MNMNEDSRTNSLSFNKKIVEVLDRGVLTPDVQERLDRTYAALGQIPQESPIPKRRFLKASLAVAIAAACSLFVGVAFAASGLLKMGSSDAVFFASQSELPVYKSMENAAKELSAEVNLTTNYAGMLVTFNSISCDKNVANLYLTLHKDGGFDLEEAAIYEGSQESDWVRLQSLLPVLFYTISGEDGVVCEGGVSALDAYRDGDDIKCLMRITPQLLIPDRSWVSLHGIAFEEEKRDTQPLFEVGLDLSDVADPKQIAPQVLTFDTTEGSKSIQIERFTTSELATVMITCGEESEIAEQEGRGSNAMSGEALSPYDLLITDNAGNALQRVEAGDNRDLDSGTIQITEYAGLSPNATSLTFTPILLDEAAFIADPGLIKTVDVTEPGARIEISDLGGFELTQWKVEDRTVSLMMKPYGFVDGVAELTPISEVTMLEEPWVDPDTGESGIGLHSAVAYYKWDYATGEMMQIVSYYAATDEELKALHCYGYHAYPVGALCEDRGAAKVLPFQ